MSWSERSLHNTTKKTIFQGPFCLFTRHIFNLDELYTRFRRKGISVFYSRKDYESIKHIKNHADASFGGWGKGQDQRRCNACVIHPLLVIVPLHACANHAVPLP